MDGWMNKSSGNQDYTYTEMVERIGENRLHEKFVELRASINHFIEEAGYAETAECNDRILMNLLLDYFADISRNKNFHEVEWTRTEKSFAYLIYWIVRRKPIQFTRYSEEERDIYVNERLAAFLMLNECLLCGERRVVGTENQEKLDEYINLLFYYFKYRDYSPQAIELAISSFKIGTLVSQ